MTYKIVIFPSKHIQEKANAFRKRYDPQFPKIPPHITIKSDFSLTDVKETDIIQELKKIAEYTTAFPIHVSKVSSFTPVTNTIYFKIEPTSTLTTLFEKMHRGIFPNQQQFSFVPHITIAQNLVDDEYSDVFGSLQMKDIALDDTINDIHLCQQLENGTWSVKKTFILGQETKANKGE